MPQRDVLAWLIVMLASLPFARVAHAAPATTAPVFTAAQRSINFDFDWQFAKNDPAAAMMPGFDDSTWRHLDVPHDWSIEGPFSPEYASGTGFAPGGIGWYRKHFKLDPALQFKQVAVEFDGVYANSQVYLNGFLVGGRPYGFSSFDCDLTPYLNFGTAENVIAVRVDHSRFADSRFYTGSGIYRNVRLRVTNYTHIASHGLYVTTPQIDDQAAVVHVETSIEFAPAGQTAKRPAASLQLEVLARDGTIAAAAGPLPVLQDSSPTQITQELRVDHPQRWSLNSPTLYTLRARVLDESQQVLDQATVPFGIRTIRFDSAAGFFLNEQSLKIKGVCIHHDAGCLGAAVPEKVLARRLTLLKEIGVNAIRTSHNPPDPQLLDLCDQLGLLVMDEALDEFTPAKNKWVAGTNAGIPSHWGYSELFSQWATTDVADLVLRDRNHPSVILWSIGNEVDYANDPFSSPALGERYRPQYPPASELVRLGKPLVAAVKRLDLTRPVTAAMANLPVSNAAGFADLLDVDGYNYQEDRYAEDHRSFPARVIFGSENGHGFGAWAAVRDHPFISAQFLWTGIDYLGESRGWPDRTSRSGLLDTAGFEKPLGWFRQSLWSDKPMVYLCTSSGTAPATRPGGVTAADNGQGPVAPASPTTQPQRSGQRSLEPTWNRPAGSLASVTGYSNCEQVRLFLNDKLVGSTNADQAVDGVFSWKVPFEPGTLKAVGMVGGQPACAFTLKTAGPAARILLTTADSRLRADATDVCQAVITVVDADGNRVPDAKVPVTVNVTGPGKLLGIDNGEQVGDVRYAASERPTAHGRALVIVQSTTSVGAVEIEASSGTLEPARLTVPSE